MNLKSWKTTAVGVSQLVLGLVAFVLWSLGEIDVKELVGSIAFIVWIGGIVGNLFAKDGDVTHSNKKTAKSNKTWLPTRDDESDERH